MTTRVSRTMKRTQETSYGNVSSDYVVNGKQVILNIIGGCFQMLFLLIITLVGNEVLLTDTFDNTAWINTRLAQLQPCQITGTEHFSQSTDEYSEGRLIIHSSRILDEIVKHLLFLLPIERHIYLSESQDQFITFVNFITTFDYTSMPEAADYLRACHSLLFLKQNESFLCKDGKTIHFKIPWSLYMIVDTKC